MLFWFERCSSFREVASLHNPPMYFSAMQLSLYPQEAPKKVFYCLDNTYNKNLMYYIFTNLHLPSVVVKPPVRPTGPYNFPTDCV